MGGRTIVRHPTIHNRTINPPNVHEVHKLYRYSMQLLQLHSVLEFHGLLHSTFHTEIQAFPCEIRANISISIININIVLEVFCPT